MSRLLAIAMLVTLAGCKHEIVRETPSLPKPPQAAIVMTVTESAKCRRIDPADLKGQEPAEGSILHTFDISKRRRAQILRLSSQLDRIHALLKRGCVELP